MALLNPTFFFGCLVLIYLSSFVLLAVFRIVTGVSIQRIGYLSLRRIAWTPRDGCRIEIRGLGINVHRPTFAQPTWLSVVVSELVTTIDVNELEGHKQVEPDAEDSDSEVAKDAKQDAKPAARKPPLARRATTTVVRSETWKKLTRIKDKIKRLHRNINWLKLVDVIATNSTVNIVDVGSIQVGSFTLAVDTRTKMVDRVRFFARLADRHGRDQQAEWTASLRSVLFTAEGNESMEILDQLFINVHGHLYKSMEGLREAAVAIKMGRLHIPFDDLQTCLSRLKQRRAEVKTPGVEEPVDIFLGKVAQELDDPGTTNEDLMRTVSDSKEFFSSILRGIKEIQFAVSFLGMSKKVQSIKPGSTPIQLNAAMKEVGIDLHRLDSKSPAHRMYFPAEAIAHEALAAALSISVGLDDGHGQPERLLYIPMATTTIKTTLLSKTVEVLRASTVDERNANIMFANSVVTSPSVDLDPHHLPLLIALFKSKPKAPKAQGDNHHLISRLLPKANYKFSMHEPVVRIKLQPLQKAEDPDDFDLIISSISSISLDMESSHSLMADMHYSLDGSLRLQSHDLYYQTNNGERFNLITTESLDMRLHLGARPDVYVDVSGNLQSCSISMIRPEIIDGLRQIVQELRIDVEAEKGPVSRSKGGQNFLRSMPNWLLRAQFDASDFNVEIAGIDEEISDDTRGVFLHWDTVSTEYRAQRLDGLQRRAYRRRSNSRSINQSDSEWTPPSSSPRNKKKPQNIGDGRKLTLFASGIEAQIMDAVDTLEPEPFLSIPRLELSLGASSDANGPTFNVQVGVRTIRAKYSLYRHYAVGVVVMTLRKAFMRTGHDAPRPKQQGSYVDVIPGANRLAPPGTPDLDPGMTTITPELVTLDFKAALVQLKAEMPHDPAMMLHMYGLEVGRQRWSTPYVAAKLVRLYTEPPRMRNVWARLLSIKAGRLDFRESRRKTSQGKIIDEKMIDIATEAVRIAVPHEVIFSQVTDNFTNVIKAVQQLHHRFRTGTNEYILEKKPEGPKSVPKVSIRTRNFLFELEDGGFEWKLGMIYRTGLIEQTQRIARENAFKVKLKKVREDEIRRGTSKLRSRSTFARGRPEMAGSPGSRSRSVDDLEARDVRPNSQHGRIPRYNPNTDSLRLNGVSKVTEHYARSHLDMFNAQSWKKRIDHAYQLSQDSMKESRGQFWGPNQVPEDVEESENLLEVPPRPALMAAVISDLHFMIDKPTFPMKDLPDFLHKIGKGMPKDMQYSLLVPMHVSITMGEAKVTLRDYPLPLVHLPPMKYGQSSKIQAVSLKANFVVAEEFRGVESTRRVRVNVVPPKSSLPGSSNEGSFAIEVRRTVGPVKSYSDVYMDVNSALPTRITWGPCYQPAIQDMMMVIESFTKPQFDPSERVGFWDKLRLNFHSRIHASWKGDGDVHLALKGTRNPYAMTGNGAGFLMCWRNDIRWNINADDDPKRFISVESGEYILAVPDYSHEVREQARRQYDVEGYLPEDNYKSEASFKKVVMKLSGKVKVMAGLIFERAIEDGVRSFEFRPHYDIVLKNPHFAKPDANGLPYDALRGFRSRHIHLSIAIHAPADRDWLSDSPEPSRSYNTIHLTPRFFTHFFNWWGLFGQPLSLPIRQGSLFPGREKNSKKFGRHLATVKYNILLAPLFLSHIYKHKDVEDHSENAVSATGLKVRFDSFSLDLHQRREEFNTLGKGKHGDNTSKTSGIKIHAAQLDLVSADVRAVSASLKGTTTEAIKKGSMATMMHETDDKPDLSRFTIPDNDFSWIDMDDFVEIDWITPTEPHPDTKILPLAYAPRLTYFRQTDIGGVIAGDPTRTSPFGNEPTHFCVMRHDDDPRRIQGSLIQDRLEQLAMQMENHDRDMGEAELRVIKCDAKDRVLVEEFRAFQRHTVVLQEKKEFLEQMLNQARIRAPSSTHRTSGDGRRQSVDSTIPFQDETMEIPATSEFESEFSNRFVIHNMQLKWNNTLRNIVLRYLHQNSQRRGFTYYLSRPAIKFILDIVEEQNKAKAQSKPGKAKSTHSRQDGRRGSRASSMKGDEDPVDMEERIKRILNEGRKFTSATWSTNADGVVEGSIEDLVGGIAEEFTPQSSYHIRIIAPQIQLQSDKNKKNVVLATAKGMELKVMEVMEKERISDNVSGLVQRRFLVNMDSVQFFVTHRKWFQTSPVSMYVGSKYGAPSGSSFPPWVPIEVVFDFQADPFGFKRVVQKTSAMVRYDKYNTLRLKYNDEVNTDGNEGSSQENTETRMDNLWVEFPTARALCNSSQYYALYVIVLDLLMYNEPMEKTRNERLEKIILASDFSDLSGAPAMVQKLQQRIRQMEEIKDHFQIYAKFLDKKGWEDRLRLENDLAACEDELFFMMKAITSSQRKFDVNSDDSTGLLKWNITIRDIVWHLMQDSNEPLVELQLKDLEYDRTDNSDGSHVNLIRVGKVLGLNLLPDATYPEMIAPYIDPERPQPKESENKEMIRVYWYMLEAIAGIPVMDRFEVNLFPIKVQLEHEVGKRLFEYIFPGINGEKSAGTKNDSPFMLKQVDGEEDDDDDDDGGPAPSYTGRHSSSSSFSTGSGSLELRLRPTLTSNTKAEAPPGKGLRVNTGNEGHSFRLFRAPGTSKTMLKKASHESLRSNMNPRVGLARAATGRSHREDPESRENDKKSRFGLSKRHHHDKPPSDDLTKMMTRASHFMTFASIKMPSVVLCLSYRGKENRNIEDVHDFVFRMPGIEWENKTWSNLDLALALKKAVVKALISHTGALIGNKFSKHRPNAEQRDKLRVLANSSVLIAPSSSGGSQHHPGSINDSDDSGSMYGTSPVDFSRSPPRSIRAPSTHGSVRPGSAMRRRSRSSSVKSRVSHRNGGAAPGPLAHHGPHVPAFLMMTPPTPVDDPRGDRHHGIELLRPSTASPQSSMHSQFGQSQSITPSNSYAGSMHSASTQSSIPLPAGQQPRPGFRRIPTGVPPERPASSMSSHDSSGSGMRRKNGASNLKDKLSAFTSRLGNRESNQSQQEDDSETLDESPTPAGPKSRSRRSSSHTGSRLNWTASRMKTG